MATSESEIETMSKVLRGDRSAYQDILARNFPKLLSLCEAYTRDSAMARAAVVEATSLGMRRAAVFDGRVPFLAWMGDYSIEECRRKLGRDLSNAISDKIATEDHESVVHHMAALAMNKADDLQQRMAKKHLRGCTRCAEEMQRVQQAVAGMKPMESVAFEDVWQEIETRL